MREADPVEPDAADPRPRPRTSRVTTVIVGLGLLVAASWAAWTMVTSTWDAGLLVLRGEVRPATVVAVEHHTRLGRVDDLVVALPGAGTVALTTPREDLEPGAPVLVVVDPGDPTRAALESDGWPWRATLMPAVLAVIAGFAGLFAVGLGLVGPTDEDDPEP